MPVKARFDKSAHESVKESLFCSHPSIQASAAYLSQRIVNVQYLPPIRAQALRIAIQASPVLKSSFLALHIPSPFREEIFQVVPVDTTAAILGIRMSLATSQDLCGFRYWVSLLPLSKIISICSPLHVACWREKNGKMEHVPRRQGNRPPWHPVSASLSAGWDPRVRER